MIVILRMALLLALLAAATQVGNAQPDIRAIVARAADKLRTGFEDQSPCGGRRQSKKGRKRFTVYSRAMELHNSIFKGALALLLQETNMTLSDAQDALNKLHVTEPLNDVWWKDSLLYLWFSSVFDKNAAKKNKEEKINQGLAAVDTTCDTSISPTCNANYPFRTIRGTCNNLENPFWGAQGVAMRRFVPATYDNDDNGTPLGGKEAIKFKPKYDRKDRTRGKHDDTCINRIRHHLPHPRTVSFTFHPDKIIESAKLTNLVTQVGQFLDHDITLTPETEVEHCCTTEMGTQGCFPITVPKGDPFFPEHGQTCLEFTRSIEFCGKLTDKREQFNEITAFIDASNVYASEEEIAHELRGDDGLLRVETNEAGKDLLIRDEHGDVFGGDIRAGENPGLSSLHALFVREHNRIAKGLRILRPNKDAEWIYQMARKIVGSEMQKVVYGQFLPALLGPKTMRKFKLDVNDGKRTKYDETVDPSVNNAFATAAYRIGHTLVQGTIQTVSTTSVDRSDRDSFELRLNFFDSTRFNTSNGMEEILYGMFSFPSRDGDEFVTADLTNHLYREAQHFDFGSDLVMRNIQRGRDHGLPGYNEYRDFCGLPRACSWRRAPQEITKAKWKALSKLYKHPSDIDIFVGGFAETPLPGAVSGQTLNCLKAVQFKALRFGDRFFYTHRGRGPAFWDNDQYEQIQGRTMADILCDNTDIPETQLNVFLQISESNPTRPCTERTPLDLEPFVKDS